MRWGAGARVGCEGGRGGRCVVGYRLGPEVEWGSVVGVRKVQSWGVEVRGVRVWGSRGRSRRRALRLVYNILIVKKNY